MPIATIQGPNGQSFQIEHPEGATDEQILQFAQSQGLLDQKPIQQPSGIGSQQKELPSFAQSLANVGQGAIDTNLGLSENVLSLGASALLQPVAGIGGLLSEGAQQLGFDTPDGAEAVRAIQGLAYQPKTERGQEIQQGLGQAIQGAGEFVTENITKPLGIDDLGGKTFEATGSPALATIVDIMPELAAELVPAGAIGGKIIKNSRNARKIISDKIRAGDIDAGNIAKTLDSSGQLIKNPRTKQAIKLMGDDDAAYSTAINFEKMNAATKSQVNKMLDIIESNKKSGDPTQIMINRPSNVIGESLARRVNKLDKIKRDASKKIGEIVDGEVGKQAVNVNQAKFDFFKALREADIDIDVDPETGAVVAGLDRTLTNIDEVIKPAKLNNILNMLQDGGFTAKQAHKLKRNLREMVSYDPAKPGSVKVSAEIEQAIKKLSSDLGDSVSAISPDYKRANQVMAESLDALKKADKALGNNLMIGDDLADAKFGSLAKRIGSNLASKESVLDLVKSVDDALAKRGVNFGDDIPRQVAALADLEKIFKVESAQSPFGFQSRVAQGAAEAMTGQTGVTTQALDFALDKFRQMKQGDFESRMRALRALSKPRD